MVSKTIEEYLKKKQPINNETDENGLYKHVISIDFATYEVCASILVARIDEKTYALGWKLRDKYHGDSADSERLPSIRATTTGDINKLLYGMTKVLQRQLKRKNSKELKIVVNNAVMQVKDLINTAKYINQ